MSRLTEFVEGAMRERRPGRALTWLARTPIPVLVPERFARRAPDRTIESSISPLVEACEPRAAPAGVLDDGDVVVKDQIDVAGLSTGVGLLDGGDVATEDATIVTRITAAGGRIIGKAKMTELGMDGIGTLMHYDMPQNPRAPGYVPGGSSTGTAVAVASGLARYGVGGDGLGSVRIPAAFCGLVGLKPGRARLPRAGIRSPVRTIDAVGPITRDVGDCVRLWQVMVGEPIEELTPWTPERIGVPVATAPMRVARSIEIAVQRALGALGSVVERVALPQLDRVTFLGGMIGAHELATGPYAGRTCTAAGRMNLALGRSFGTRDVEQLERARGALCDATERAFERTPILAMPTTAIPPPAITHALFAGHQELLMMRALGAFTPLANLVDLPSIAVPCGVDGQGRPLSIMFVARRGEETSLLRLALALERTGLGAAPVS